MLAQEIIRIKRDGGELSPEHIKEFVSGIPNGEVSEGQVAAFTMAVLLKGMNLAERTALTKAMTHSGRVIDWSEAGLDGPILDKHSTGGVGDKVSLMLAPIIAACGGYVPMLSGRGLGHTGGTLDKMDSIPGYISQPDMDLFSKVTQNVGCAIIGATTDLAPADRIMYGIRDVTATVESIDLITASILSKKLAAGLDGLVMDVKFGNGAFMEKYDDAKALAESIVGVANDAGTATTALMTDMDEVLGRTAGNAVEVREAVEFLTQDDRDMRLYEVTTGLCAELLVIGKLADDKDDAWMKVNDALNSGRAAEKFQEMVSALSGPNDFLEKYDEYLPLAPVVRHVMPVETGYVTGLNTRALGVGIVEIGGGRSVPSDDVNHRVGLGDVCNIGDQVGSGGAPLATVYAEGDDEADHMAKILKSAITVADEPPKPKPYGPVRERIAREQIKA